MTATETTAEKVKAELRDRDYDIDDDEFDAKVDEYLEKFGEHGDEGFAAFAVAKEEYGEKIRSEFVVDDQGAPPEEQERYTMAEIRQQGAQLDNTDENFAIEGMVIARWFSESDDGKPRWNLRIMDESGESLRAMASGMDAVANFESAEPELGDYIRVGGVSVFHSAADAPDDDDFNLLMIGQYVEYQPMEPFFDLADVITTNVVSDPAKDGDVVYIEGIVSDYESNTYNGCPNCSKGWDPEETNACPKCGSTDITELTFDTLKIRSEGMEPLEVQFSPDLSLKSDDPTFDELRIYGTYDLTTDDSGTQKKLIRAFDYANLSRDDAVEPKAAGGDASSGDEAASEGDASSEESEDDASSDEAADVDTDDVEYDIQTAAERVEEQVQDMEYPIPATTSKTLLESSLEIPEDDVDEVLVRAIKIASSWGTIEWSIEDDSDADSMRDARWQNVILETAGD